MPASGPDPEDEQTCLDVERSSADLDQTHSREDQAGADRDQDAADLDQRASDTDQAASDRDLAHGLDRDVYDNSRDARVRTTQARRVTARERLNTASARDATAHERDLCAQSRDQIARARDDAADEREAQIALLTSYFGAQRATTYGQAMVRAACDRQLAMVDRARSAEQRAIACADRDQAAGDRLLAAEDRALAAEDRAQAATEREAAEVDMLTGARRRAPGLADMQRDIDRAHRGSGQLIAAYVDVDGLKATNDSQGHRAGDQMLRHIVEVMQRNLRTCEPIVRLGGDEFVCTLSDTTIGSVRERFAEIAAQLSLTPHQGSITVGFAELAPGDSPMDLIDRADRKLIASRDANHQAHRTRP